MSDRRTKERERVWGRRPVILRFDSGHPRRNVEPETTQLSEQVASSLLNAFFQSVIQTDALAVDSRRTTNEKKRSARWHLVEPGESVSQPVRKPIEIEPAAAPADEPSAETVGTDLAESPEKPRHRPFWRLQSPHLSLHVFSPERT